MSQAIFVVLLSRVAIGIASGEIAIRYLEWWWRVRREPTVVRSVLLGISLAAFCIWGIEVTYMWVRSSPPFVGYVDLTSSSVLFEGWRVGLFFSSLWLAAPVMFAHYRKNPKQALLEMAIRLFLIGMTALGTWELAVVHFCSNGGCR